MSDMITSDRLQWLLDIVERSLAEPNLMASSWPATRTYRGSTSTGWWRRRWASRPARCAGGC
jgi:hypothetical protein